MKRIDYTNKINTYTARFVLEVEGFNATNQYHINIHAENFLIPVLNEIFNLQLENLNDTQKKNFPAIDLADFKNRVAFQITSTSTTEKIKSTLKTFNEKKLDTYFDTFVYLYYYRKKGKISGGQVKGPAAKRFSI
ncbi:MAG: SMEK domain-containing protein [Chitinophagaceae bacterium]